MIRFLKYTKLYFLLSLVVISVGLFSIFTYGYTYSIDFTGGTFLEYKASGSTKLPIKTIAEVVKDNKADIEVKNQIIRIKARSLDEQQEVVIRQILEKKLQVKKLTILRFETVGPSVSRDIVRTTTTASIIAAIGILLYMTYAFKKITHGLAAVLAMFHDFIVLIGVYSLLSKYFGAEFDTLFVTAMLTTMSFSVHDTIVVFDKIREYSRVSVKPIDEFANKALTETMVRSINNSLTIMLMLIPLTLFGGETIRFFAAALLIGTITGTYSSPFIATPLLVFFEKLMRRYKR